MGLKKEIILDNGIVVNYHRIVSLNKITNHANIIEVASYTSQSKRQEEIDSLQQSIETQEYVPINVFINTEYISKEYNEAETIADAYNYLKTLEKYNGAENS